MSTATAEPAGDAMVVLARQAPKEVHLCDLVPPPYEAGILSKPFFITFCRFTSVHKNSDPNGKHNYIGRRVGKESDVAVILPVTTWNDFVFLQVHRSCQLYDWDGEAIPSFSYNVLVKLGRREILVDHSNWDAVRDLMIFREPSAEFVFSICPSSVGEPSMLKIAECVVLRAGRTLGKFLMRK